MARARRRSVGIGPRHGSVLLAGGRSAWRRGRGPRFGGAPRRRLPWRWIAMLVVVAGIGAGVLGWHSQVQAREDRHAAAVRFVGAWERGDHAAMWRALAPKARARYPRAVFTASYRRANRRAGVTAVRAGQVGDEKEGRVSLAVAVRLRDFGSLRGRMTLALTGSGEQAGVEWRPALVLPGLRPGERVVAQARARPGGGRPAAGRDAAGGVDRRRRAADADGAAARL